MREGRRELVATEKKRCVVVVIGQIQHPRMDLGHVVSVRERTDRSVVMASRVGDFCDG